MEDSQFVLDGSITLAWSLGDEDSEYAHRVLEDLATRQALAPSIWPLEVANGLVMAVRRNRLAQRELSEVRESLRELTI